MEISLCTLIPLFRPWSVHSGSTSWNDCGQVFSDKLRASSFPDRSPHYAWTAAAYSAHSDFNGSRMYACYQHFWENDWGLLCATMVTQTPNKSQHTKLTLEKKTLQLLPPGLELAPFNHESGVLPTTYPSSPMPPIPPLHAIPLLCSSFPHLPSFWPYIFCRRRVYIKQSLFSQLYCPTGISPMGNSCRHSLLSCLCHNHH